MLCKNTMYNNNAIIIIEEVLLNFIIMKFSGDQLGHAATKPDKVNISIIKDFRDQ